MTSSRKSSPDDTVVDMPENDDDVIDRSMLHRGHVVPQQLHQLQQQQQKQREKEEQQRQQQPEAVDNQVPFPMIYPSNRSSFSPPPSAPLRDASAIQSFINRVGIFRCFSGFDMEI